ncbi:MAG: hypothetical protein AAFO80_04595 [Pseudomonadota bacterium]
MFDLAFAIVQVFYIITAARLYSSARTMSHTPLDPADLDLLWPLAWMTSFSADVSTAILANAYVVVGFLSIFLWRFLWMRILVMVVLLQHTAWPNSFGAIHHGNHEWFWLSVCFLFLPTGVKEAVRENRRERTRFLYAFSIAPALILFFYSLSGLYKVYYATLQFAKGQYGGFMPDAMAQTLARRALETGSEPMWADVIINYPLLGWPMYLGLYFVELFAIVILFRPALHRIWGFILIAFHFGTLTFMDIVFGQHVLINGLLFVMSPFAPRVFNLREALVAIPLFGPLFVDRIKGMGRQAYPAE